jgi:hypothetical protein
MPNGDEAFPVCQTEVGDPDHDFSAALAATIVRFDADLTMTDMPATEHVAIAETAIEAAASATERDDLYPGLAYQLNREGEAVSAEVSVLVGVAEPHTLWELATESVSEGPAEVPNRLEALSVPTPEILESKAVTTADTAGQRLEAAVRLTGQALHAWLSLLQTPSLAYDSTSPTRNR